MTSTAQEGPFPPSFGRYEEEAQTRELLVHLSMELQTQFHCIEHEVNRTQALLEDAIVTLTRSFTAIHDALDIPLPQEGAAKRATDPTTNLHERLADDLNAALRSLQFQDMTHQLLDHVTRRVADMGELLNEIVEASITRPEFAEFLHAGRAAVERHGETADERGVGPVSQGQCEAGDIELF
ncbi:hypothetical protein [Methylococcus sp. EFPC2]|uniref:hypothetical protein n=1 Tax=Methylococcus sp. EFPC2 TaxID=2812648 RepID=UPI00196837F9|nr:hypothetical protein [Methylococcus sp. EFPC2]QSA98693.1 hypothetical protein JWZ97_07875 [Methylococcus sp. EFPC2]